jgi:hypothetical protein
MLGGTCPRVITSGGTGVVTLGGTNLGAVIPGGTIPGVVTLGGSNLGVVIVGGTPRGAVMLGGEKEAGAATIAS